MNKTIKDRKRIAKRYNSKFKKCTNIQLPFEELGYENVYWYYAIVINSAEYNKLLENLDANGIDYRHFFHPLHKQPFINSKETLVVSEHLYRNGLILPTYTGLKNKDIDFICKVVLETLL
jgi:perosamine synthetase